MALEKTDNHPLFNNPEFAPSWQIITWFLGNQQPLAQAPPGPHVLLCYRDLRVLSLCSHIPLPARVASFLFYILRPSSSPGPQKALKELAEGINGDKCTFLPLRPCNSSVPDNPEESRSVASQGIQRLNTIVLSTGLWRKGRPADLGEVRVRTGATSFGLPSTGLPASLAQQRPGFLACLPLA